MEVTTGSPEAEYRTSPQRHPPFMFGTGVPPDVTVAEGSNGVPIMIARSREKAESTPALAGFLRVPARR
jgi:hypothetical protein